MSILEHAPASVDHSPASAARCAPDELVAQPAPRFELHAQSCEGYTVVTIWGELRGSALVELNARLDALVAAGCRQVLLDLSRLYDLDADAICELTRWRDVLAASSGCIRLAAPRPWVRRLLEYMCLRGTFAVYPTVLAARAEIMRSVGVSSCG
jgi:anti-anti-sigma regulatory factor